MAGPSAHTVLFVVVWSCAICALRARTSASLASRFRRSSSSSPATLRAAAPCELLCEAVIGGRAGCSAVFEGGGRLNTFEPVETERDKVRLLPTLAVADGTADELLDRWNCLELAVVGPGPASAMALKIASLRA